MSRNKATSLAHRNGMPMMPVSGAASPSPFLALRALGVIAFALLLGSVLPALLAYYDDVFTQEAIRRKLPPVAQKIVADFQITEERLKHTLTQIDQDLQSSTGGSETQHRLLESRQIAEVALRANSMPLHYYGYIGNPSPQFYFPLFLITLGTLAFVVRPHVTMRSLRRAILMVATTIAIYSNWQWFHWVRNFVAGEESRRIYTYTNWDISPICFACQELQVIVICWLIATIWQQWLDFYRIRVDEIRSTSDSVWHDPLNDKTVERLSETFSRWQIASLLLVAAFSTFFAFYWRNIQGRGDIRYLVSALGIHLIGIISWIIVSLPMTVTWKHWHGLRARAIYELARSTDEAARVEMRAKLIDAVKPIGSWNLLVSASLLFASFVIPIVQMVIR